MGKIEHALLIVALMFVAVFGVIAWRQDREIQDLKAEVVCHCDCGCTWNVEAERVGITNLNPLPDPEKKKGVK